MQILVGITGGIAAYKAVNLIRLLSEAGHQVKVLPTANALRFIGAATLEAISHNSVDPDLYTDVDQVKHIKLAQEADLVIIAPATAAFLARYANGLADDLLLNVLLATKARVLLAPAMHSEMWEHAATQENIRILKSRGVEVAEPTIGKLTGSDSGIGRMMEPEEICRAALAVNKQSLAGRKILIAAGGTQEPIDDVRYIGNSSSGKQGVALAEEALSRGAQVVFVDCNMSVPVPNGARRIQARTTNDLFAALSEQIAGTDILFMPVAVSDFSAVEVKHGKIKREENSSLNLELKQNPDIIRQLKQLISTNNQKTVTIAFAAETVTSFEELTALASLKLENKGVDMVVANDVTQGQIFGSDQTKIVIVDSSSATEHSGSKKAVSKIIVDRAEKLLMELEVR